MATVNLTIDGKEVSAETGETLLDCALRHDINIPHLCTHSALEPFGACRMCLVEVEGMRGYPPSCTTPAASGMVVQTNTDKLQKLRRNILALTMLEHPNACLTCGKRELCEEFRPHPEKVGRTTGCHTCNNKDFCEVRVLSSELGLESLPVEPRYFERPLERSSPFIDRDLNLCILCGRCVRICKHQQGTAVIDFVGRSNRTQIGEAFGRSLQEAGCTFCGSCVDVCPTGTLSDRYAKWYGVPENKEQTTCIYCDAACAVEAGSVDNRLVSAQAVNEGVPICVLGRFAIPEMQNGPDRLQFPYVRVGEVLRQLDWEQALPLVAEKLGGHAGEGFALVCDTTTPIEDRHLLKKFTQEVMKSDKYVELTPDARGVSKASLPAGTKAALLTGAFVDSSELEGLDLLVVMDCYPTPTSEGAEAVLPVAIFTETRGTALDANGDTRPLRKASNAPGLARPEWQTICALAQAMEAKGFDYESSEALTEELGLTGAALAVERDAAPEAAKNPRLARTWFRGHSLAERVSALRQVVAPEAVSEAPAVTDAACAVAEVEDSDEGFRVVSKREIAPNAYELVIEAPEVAKKAEAGQFAIVMVDATSERVPYTLCNWDKEAGTITMVVQEKGRSSRKFVLVEPGDRISHVVGPLGIPFEMKNYGNVVLAGGCYGIGAIMPIARALKAEGNHIVSIAEARSHYMAYYGKELEELSDEFVQTTVDGSLNRKGHATDVIAERLKAGEKIDCVVAIGCPFMMMLTAKDTKPFGVKTWASLNPIMVDGTGMCGACRLTVGEDVKFACVDGPFFDAHLVDWDEVRDRREAYSFEEVQAVGQTEAPTAPHAHAHACTCK